MDRLKLNDNTDQDLKHNILVNIADGAFFGFGVGFASYTTIIPLFVANLTTSATLIGLIPAIHNMGWQLPQLLLANKISRMKKIKPFVAFMTTQERLPILGLAFVGLLLPKIGVTAALIASFILLVWQGLGSGLTANAWQIMISKVIPGNIRGTFFGAQSAAANLLASLGALLAGLLLVKLKPPYDFSTLFFIASGLYVLSWFFLNMTRETAPIPEGEIPPPPPLWQNIKSILRNDLSFRNFLISRFISQFGMMAFAFYTVFAVKNLNMSVLTVGVMTSVLMITQVVANPLLGRLADKWSGKGVLVLGGLSAVLSAILAIIIKNPNWFVLVFILNGIAATAYWTIGITMSLQFGDERQRPTYVGMSNTLIAPSAILAPLVGGLLADSFGYSVTFITSASIGLISVAALARLVKDPRKHAFK